MRLTAVQNKDGMRRALNDRYVRRRDCISNQVEEVNHSLKL